MASRLIVDYKVAWKYKRNTGAIYTKFEGASKFSKVPVSNHEEFLAVLMLLQGEKPVFLDRDKEVLTTHS